MHDQRKYSGISGADAVKDHHRNDGEMPGACAVRRRYYDGDASTDEHHKSRRDGQACRKIETEERYIELDKVTKPDKERIEYK